MRLIIPDDPLGATIQDSVAQSGRALAHRALLFSGRSMVQIHSGSPIPYSRFWMEQLDIFLAILQQSVARDDLKACFLSCLLMAEGTENPRCRRVYRIERSVSLVTLLL